MPQKAIPLAVNEMSKGILLGISLVGLIFLLVAFSGLDNREEILEILQRQKEAWNRGDLEEFMAYYLKAESLTFQSGANRWRGWEALFERYKKNYPREKMGQLDFTDLEVNFLGKDHAYVLGCWKLSVGQEKREGVFTLILKRFSYGWRIIHDHTS